jgi:hypothetical protein
MGGVGISAERSQFVLTFDGVQVDAVGFRGRVLVVDQGVLQVLEDSQIGCFIVVASTRESHSSV